MKRPTRRQLAELGQLQKELQRITAERNQALRVFEASRIAATRDSQYEFWLEVSWIDLEYRATVEKIAILCGDIRRAIV